MYHYLAGWPNSHLVPNVLRSRPNKNDSVPDDPDLRQRAYLTAVRRGAEVRVLLAQIGGRGWVVVGSLNGGEVSAKLNREMALKVASDEAYSYLADVFWYDRDVTP